MPNHIHFILTIGAGVSGTSRAPSTTIYVNTLFICRGDLRSPLYYSFSTQKRLHSFVQPFAIYAILLFYIAYMKQFMLSALEDTLVSLSISGFSSERFSVQSLSAL